VASRVVLPEPPAGRPLLVAIDGCSGSGKSTLAGVIAAELSDVTVVHGDDFYAGEPDGWESWTPAEGHARFWDVRAMERDLLLPLRSGAGAAYRPFDWDLGRRGATTAAVPASTVVIVEGVSTLRPELRGYWDFSIYVDTPPYERLRRILAREENDRVHIDQWNAAEEYYCRTFAPRAAASVVVSGSGILAGTPSYPSFILPG
jgi:uridine kinase